MTAIQEAKLRLTNAAKKAMRSINLREDVQYHREEKAEKKRVYINEDGVGVVENVKILGFRSRNKNRRYAFDGIEAELYEGIPVNIDHPDPDDQKKPRDYIARFGWVEGIYKTMEGLFARYFYFNPEHCHAKGFIWWAKHAPDKIGFSQNAFGDVYDDDEGEVVDRVNDVRSIDLVADPATTKGIFEAMEEPNMPDPNATAVKKTEEVKKVTKKPLQETKAEGDIEHETDHDVNIEKHAPIMTMEGEEDDFQEAEEDDFEEDVKKKESKESKAEEHKERLTEDDEEDMEEDEDDGDNDEDDAGLNAGGPTPVGNKGTDEEAEGDKEETEDKDTDEGTGTLSDKGGPDIEDELCSACEKIFRDKKLPFRSKVKKIVHLLKLHHSGLEEAFMPKDLTDAKAHLQEKLGKDQSVRLVLEALDQHEVTTALRAKRGTIKRLLKDAKLPKEAVTPYFERKLLEATDEREIQEMIEDRRLVTGPIRSEKPRSAAGDSLLLREGRPAGPEQSKQEKRLTTEEKQKLEEAAYDQFEAAVMG